MLGYCVRNEVLPDAVTRWRIPGWVVGVRGGVERRGEGFEGLRRRMEGEGSANASGSDGRDGGTAGRRRTLGGQVWDSLRGA